MGKVLKYCFALLTGLIAVPAWADFDPTAPPRLKPAGEAPVESGLAWVRVNGKDSIAWYGGAPVKLGDRVEDGRIVAIHEDHIVIAGPQGRRIIPLFDAQLHNKPAAPARPARRP